MKKINFLFLLPLVVSLFSCGNNKPDENQNNSGGNGDTDELIIPTVDVNSIDLVLPDKPVRNYEDLTLKSDDTYDYFDIFEISDFHGAVNYNESGEIGLSRLATFLEDQREENPAGTIVLSTGDMFQGSCESNLTRGYMVNYAMNYMGFDAMSIGNHEFDWGAEWIKKNSELEYDGYRIPFLGANIIDTRTNEVADFCVPSTVITRHDYKIGIVGTIESSVKSSIARNKVSNYNFTDEYAAVYAEAGRLKQNGCDIVVWLNHGGIQDMSYGGIEKSDGVDVAFGGHTHSYSYIYTTDFPYAQSSDNGEDIAHITLKINKITKEVSNSYTTVHHLLRMGTILPNTDIDSIMGQYSSEIDNIKNIVVGHTDTYLSRSQYGLLKDIFVDAIQSSTKKYLSSSENTTGIKAEDAVVAYTNVSGGIRDDIDEGDITFGEVYKALPFDNELILFKRDGYYLKNTVLSYRDYAIWHSFESVYDLDFYKEDYYVMTTDFLAQRFNEDEDKLIHTGLLLRDEICKYLYAIGNVDPTYYESYNFDLL